MKTDPRTKEANVERTRVNRRIVIRTCELLDRTTGIALSYGRPVADTDVLCGNGMHRTARGLVADKLLALGLITDAEWLEI